MYATMRPGTAILQVRNLFLFPWHNSRQGFAEIEASMLQQMSVHIFLAFCTSQRWGKGALVSVVSSEHDVLHCGTHMCSSCG